MHRTGIVIKCAQFVNLFIYIAKTLQQYYLGTMFTEEQLQMLHFCHFELYNGLELNVNGNSKFTVTDVLKVPS